MIQLPETGFLRLSQIIGDARATPPIPPIIPVKKSCWWDGVRTGRFPKPVKFGRCTMWRVEDIRLLIDSASAQDDQVLDQRVEISQRQPIGSATPIHPHSAIVDRLVDRDTFGGNTRGAN